MKVTHVYRPCARLYNFVRPLTNDFSIIVQHDFSLSVLEHCLAVGQSSRRHEVSLTTR